MLNRFEGEKGHPVLVETLKNQATLNGNPAAVEFIASNAELLPVEAGLSIITQDREDNDIYFIVAGSFSIIVNGRPVALRSANNRADEMAAIQPTQATVTATKLCQGEAPNEYHEKGNTTPIS